MSELEMGSDKPQKARSSFSMEKELFKKLQEVSEKEDKSVSSLIEEAVKVFLSNK